MQQPARPGKDRRDGVRRRLSTLLVLAVVSCDRAVSRFALSPAVFTPIYRFRSMFPSFRHIQVPLSLRRRCLWNPQTPFVIH
jgi:hypothetical protein